MGIDKVSFEFQVLCQSQKSSARVGLLKLNGIEVETPVFMPVGTRATVKSVAPWELEEIGYQIILSNSYHLYLRPGKDYFSNYESLHKFMKWNGLILTDSGGYQIFSLQGLRKVSREGVEFSSHIDGRKIFLSPSEVVEFQAVVMGSDIMMPLDECVGYPVSKKEAQRALDITCHWLKMSFDKWRELNCGGVLFPIIQGSYYEDLRKESVSFAMELNPLGYAIGGVSVGEPEGLRWNMVRWSVEGLPEESPRYLMGVGTPDDIYNAVKLGVDMFDCVIPTRYGRTGVVFTSEGKLNIRNSRFKDDLKVLDEGCMCPACKRGFSRAYLRFLFLSGEILGLRLLVLHNLYYYFDLMQKIREDIKEGRI